LIIKLNNQNQKSTTMKIITILLCFLFNTIVLGQSNSNVENHQFKLNVIAPSLEYEKGTGNNTTLIFELGTGFALRSGSEIGTDFGFFPYVEGHTGIIQIWKEGF